VRVWWVSSPVALSLVLRVAGVALVEWFSEACVVRPFLRSLVRVVVSVRSRRSSCCCFQRRTRSVGAFCAPWLRCLLALVRVPRVLVVRVLGVAACARSRLDDSYLVDPASSHMLVSKIKPCMSKYKLLYTVKLRMAH
jgi:hypothetical protein